MHLIYAILSIILLTITSCFQTHPKAPSSRDIFSDSKSRQIPPSGNLLKLDYEGLQSGWIARNTVQCSSNTTPSVTSATRPEPKILNLIPMFQPNANKPAQRVTGRATTVATSYVIYGHVAYKIMPYGMLVSLERNKNSVA